MITSLDVRHSYPERAGLTINRPKGLEVYTFLHFWSPVTILVDGKRQQTEPGACIFYSPHTPQWYQAKTDIIHDWFHIDAAFGRYLQEFEIEENKLYYPSSTDFIRARVKSMEVEQAKGQAFCDILLENILCQFLIEFHRMTLAGEEGVCVNQQTKAAISEARLQAFENLSHRWTIEEISRLVNLSPSRFSVLYKKLYGTSCMDDIIRARIDKAKELLLGGSPVGEIASSLGYSNVYHFIRQFKKIVGTTPGKYAAF